MKKILSLLSLLMLFVVGASAQDEATYTVVGNSAAIFGTEWAPTLEANDMVKGGDGIYTKTFEGVALENGFKLEYKVVKNHSWDVSWGNPSGNDGNADYTVWQGNGTYNVTFSFNPDGAFADGLQVACAMVNPALEQAKAGLQELITKLGAFNLSTLADDIAAAQTALDDTGATVETIAAATAALKAAAKEKVTEALALAEQFANTYGYNNGTFAMALTMAKSYVAQEKWNDLANAMPTFATQAKAKVQDALTKIKGYAETIDYEPFTADLTAIETAIAGEDYFATIEALQKAADDFLVGAQNFIDEVKTIDTEGKEKGAELAAALAAAEEAMDSETANIVDKGDAIKKLVQAYRAFMEANPVAEPVYTVAGGLNTENGGEADTMFGTTWDPTLTENDMVKGDDGIYTKTFENVSLLWGDRIYYKVAKDHAWTESWGFGAQNADYNVEEDGTYNVTFKFNPDATFDNGFNVDCILEKAGDEPVLTTFEVYVTNVPEGFGTPYAYVWSSTGEVSAAWPGDKMQTMRDEDTYEITGYRWQVEALSAPENIIFNNGKDGDAKIQTADLQFVDKKTYDLTELLTPAVDPFANVTVDPVEGDVSSLSEFTLTFANAVNVQGLFGEDTDKPYLISADNSFVEYGEYDYGPKEEGQTVTNQVVVRLAAEVATAGAYTLVIPAGTILADEQTNAEDLKFNYTVKGEKQFNVYVVNVPEGFGTPWAYAWSGDGDAAVPVKAWPGDKMGISEMNDDMTVVTKWVFQVTAAEAPEHIIFNNGKDGDEKVQTADLDFEDGKVYDLSELLGIEPVDPFANVTVDPVEGDVSSLSEFTLTFANAVNVQGLFGEDTDKPYLISADNSFVEYGEYDYGPKEEGQTVTNQVVVRLAAEVATAGAYTLVIPAGTILADEQTNAEDLKFNYNIKAGETTFEIFVKNVPEGFGKPYIYVWSGETQFAGAWPGTQMTTPYQFDDGSMGFTWQITLAEAPENLIFSNGKNADEEGAMQTKDLVFENRKVYDLTELLKENGIVTGISAVNAAIAEGAVVYNLQGVRVEKAYKGGLYIVNGKKVMMK